MFGIGELSVVETTVALTAIVFIFLWMKRNVTKDAGKQYLPTASALSLIIAILCGGINVLPDHFMKSAEKLGPVISYKLGRKLVIILNGKEAITEAFLRKSEAFANRAEIWTEANIHNRKRQGIATAVYNDNFKKNHKLCLSILKEFGFGVNSVSETRIHYEVETLNRKLLQLNGSPIDPKPMTALSTFNVVSSILFGKAFASSSGSQKIAEAVVRFVAHYDYALEFVPIIRFLPYIRGKIALQSQDNRDIINGVEEGIQCSRSTECESSFVKRFIEIQGSDYDHQDLVFIVRDLCLASADTVSTTLQWGIVELANHSEVQTRLQREIDGVVAKDRHPSLDDKPRLPYTEAVILEVMRRHTVGPLYLPHATLYDVEIYGFHIPRDSLVFANAVSAHMDPKSWKEPGKFKPERFLDKHQMITGSENVIPFSMGKRSCLGEILARQEIFLFLTGLVQRFDIRPPDGHDSIEVKEIISGTLQPSEFKVRLFPRAMVDD